MYSCHGCVEDCVLPTACRACAADALSRSFARWLRGSQRGIPSRSRASTACRAADRSRTGPSGIIRISMRWRPLHPVLNGGRGGHGDPSGTGSMWNQRGPKLKALELRPQSLVPFVARWCPKCPPSISRRLGLSEPSRVKAASLRFHLIQEKEERADASGINDSSSRTVTPFKTLDLSGCKN